MKTKKTIYFILATVLVFFTIATLCIEARAYTQSCDTLTIVENNNNILNYEKIK